MQTPNADMTPPEKPEKNEEAAPDNPYLHETRNLRDEKDVEIGLPKALREQPPALGADAESPDEEPAPDNPYLHESRNLRDEGEVEIGLPASLQGDPAFDLSERDDTAGSGGTADTDGTQADEQSPAPNGANGPVAQAENNGSAHNNGHSDGQPNGNGHTPHNGHGNGNGNGNGNGGAHPMSRALTIVFRPSGEFDRDKFRLKQICETVRDPKGRDRFYIEIKGQHKVTKLAFPNDPCSISDRLQQELHKFFRLEVRIEE